MSDAEPPRRGKKTSKKDSKDGVEVVPNASSSNEVTTNARRARKVPKVELLELGVPPLTAIVIGGTGAVGRVRTSLLFPFSRYLLL